MTRVFLTFTVIFILFAISRARTPLHGASQNDVNLQDSDSNVKIILPNEKPDSELNTVVDLEPEIVDSSPLHVELETLSVEPIEDMPESEPEIESVDELNLNKPMTFVTFRPSHLYSPQTRGDRLSTFRLLPHSLRFLHRNHPRHHFVVGVNLNGVGDGDMSADLALHGDNEEPNIPARFPLRGERWNNKEEMNMEVEDKVAEKQHKEEGGLVKRIRKFLKDF